MDKVINNVSKLAKTIRALNQNTIQKILHSKAFDNVGITIIKVDDAKTIAKSLLHSCPSFADNQVIVDKLQSVIQSIRDRMPIGIKQHFAHQTINDVLNYRNQSQQFNEKMNMIADYVRQQFRQIIDQYSDSFLNKKLDEWQL